MAGDPPWLADTRAAGAAKAERGRWAGSGCFNVLWAAGLHAPASSCRERTSWQR